ncbi:MAG: zinc ribbon domain-containing protein [Anaerolineales bacterium]|jgi:putative FmdB family regulatory protein
MPLFEFVCADCGKPFEQLVLNTSKINEVNCPACQSKNITKKISTFASRLSGGSTFSFGSSSSASCSTGSV